MSRREMRAAIIELAANADVDELLSFELISKVTGLDPDLPELRFAVATARPHLLREHDRALVSVRGRGYRVALPVEHAGLARRHQRSSERQLQKAVDLIEHTDLAGFTDKQRRAHENTRRAVLLLAHHQARAEERLARLEAKVFGE